MGIRRHKRQIARARLKAMGVGNVNRQMSRVQNGVKNWRRALTGKTGASAEKAQIMAGLRAKAMREAART